jgi:hypothetical protein
MLFLTSKIKNGGIPAIAAACVMLAASAHAGVVTIDPASSVTYTESPALTDGYSGEINGDYFGTFGGVVPVGGLDTFDQTFAVAGSADSIVVSLLSYFENPEPLPIFDGVLGVGPGVLVQGTNGGIGGTLNNYTLLYSATQGLTENLSWSLTGDSLTGGDNWSGTWSVTWTVAGNYQPSSAFAPSLAIQLDAPPTAPSLAASLSSVAAAAPDVPSTAILLVLAVAGLGLCWKMQNRSRLIP